MLVKAERLLLIYFQVSFVNSYASVWLSNEIWDLCPLKINNVAIYSDLDSTDWKDLSQFTNKIWKSKKVTLSHGNISLASFDLVFVWLSDLSSLNNGEALSYINSSHMCWYFIDATATRTFLIRRYPAFNSNVFLVDNGTFTVSEVYQINSVAIFQEIPHNSDGSYEGKWKRRQNLKLKHFKVGALDLSPYVTFPHEERPLHETFGFCIDILKTLKNELNFTYTLYPTKKFGSMGENGSWNGLVGRLDKGEIDFATNGIRFALN